MKQFRGIIIVGGTGRGKSSFLKEVLLKYYRGAKFIFDPRMEHYGGVIMPMEQFTLRAKACRKTMIVFEEATMFFSNKGDNEDLKWLLVSKRHDANTVVLLFHTLQSVPLYLLSMCDLLVLFKTQDNIRLVENKFKQNVGIFEAFVEVNNSKGFHARTLVKLQA